MKKTIILTIQDIEEKASYDYSIPVICKTIDQRESNAKNEKSSKYSKDLKKIMKMCAPDENELKEYIEDILTYYEDNYMSNLIRDKLIRDKIEKELILKVEVVLHKRIKGEMADQRGEYIYVSYFSVLDSLIDKGKCKYNVKGDDKQTLEYKLVSGLWRDLTGPLFRMELRYILAHEIFHLMQYKDYNKKFEQYTIMDEVFAEYFALSYINEFCNAVNFSGKDNLWLREYLGDSASFSEDEKKSGNIGKNLKNVALFPDDTDGYYAGALLMALAIKDLAVSNGSGACFGDYSYFVKIYTDLRDGAATEAEIISELKARKKEVI